MAIDMKVWEREEAAAEAIGHEIGCLQVALELITEAAAAEGTRLDGDIDELWKGMAGADRARVWLTNGTIECWCEGDDVPGFTGRRRFLPNAR